MKYAVYVEGLSELLFVADILSKYSNYNSSQCGYLCVNLHADDFTRINNPKQGDINSANYYQIVNVNNDNRVVSKLHNDLPGLIQQGFNVIIGLKDVYGKAYEQLMNGEQLVDRKKIKQLHTIQFGSIQTEDSDCRLHYAIMEYETWMLALIEQFITQKGQNIDAICQLIGIDFTTCDLEVTSYHPYPLVKKIFQACGEDYNKHEKDSYSFLSTLSVSDYENLRNSGRCPSFSKFINSLLGFSSPQLP